MNKLFEGYPDMLTVGQMAQALNIGRTMAYRLIQSGQIQSLRFGKVIRIPKTALLAAARTDEVSGGGQTGGGVSA